VCNHCPVGCNVRLDERAHALRRIVARENLAVNNEWICDKGRFVHQFVDHPERLATPLVRQDGTLRPATWDEALSRIVERFGSIIESSGPNAVGGVASARIGNEGAYLFQKFFRALIGTNNVDYPDGSAVRAHPTGLSSITDIAKSDLVVLIGIDPSEAAPLLDLHIKRAALRGIKARLLIIHPRRIELAKYPGAYLPVLPGHEAALLNELTQALQNSRPASQQAGKAQVATRRPQADAEPSRRDAPYARIIELLTSARSPLFIYGPDAAAGERGRAMVAALTHLANLLGQGDKLAYVGREANSQGCRDMGLLPDTLPGQAPIQDASVRDRLSKLWGVQPPADAGLSFAQMLTGGVKGLLIAGLDPFASSALTGTAAAGALKAVECLVVQDLFLTETAKLAEVVLPACSFAEADGTTTNLERRVQRGPQGIRPVGQSRADWAILAALAEKWQAVEGKGDPSWHAEGGQAQGAASATDVPDWKRKKRKVRQGPIAKPWNYPDVRAVLEEIGKALPAYAGIRWEMLGEAGLQWPVTALPRGAARKPESAESAPLPAAGPGNFHLVSAGLLWDGGVLMQHAAEQVRRLIPQPFVALNPADLAAQKLAEGGKVTVTSASGSVSLVVRADASVQRGTAWAPAGQPGCPAEALGAGRGEPVLVQVRSAG
jgi:predicted molibdopterin-dependent oxidoreductase YjgC